MTDPEDIARNLASIRARIAEATARANRPAGSVSLVAVSKTHPAEAAAAALAAGQQVFGENRVQEAAGKFPALRSAWPELRLHVIGALQTNKAREAVRLADVIESLDRPKLAHALAEAMAKRGPPARLPGAGECGEEPQKAGILPAETDAFLRTCREELGLPVTGLMCIPPAEGDPRPHFDWLAARAAKHGLPVVSMGMSGDFEAAIGCGATHVRVGSAIFGTRASSGPPPSGGTPRAADAGRGAGRQAWPAGTGPTGRSAGYRRAGRPPPPARPGPGCPARHPRPAAGRQSAGHSRGCARKLVA
ncbi:YggS family pyridoxal phosphate-dependent enzyme [Dankookia sp. P2]|uniref:YggS family pyridoxal phosphate-dependent enzyme n=1 Tax=Dankookia sp. P2 TaxID=3423955 RepID=UPI003D670BE0